MKILMTGMSARSVGSTKIRYDFVALSDLIHRALEELGHEVDRRVVGTDEDTLELDRYDKALVLVNWVSSLSSMHVHEAGLVLARMGRERATLYVDDWRTESLGDDIDHHVTRDHGWDHHVNSFRKDYYAGLQGWQIEAIREAYTSLVDSEQFDPWPMIIPQHSWGDIQKYLAVSKRPLNVTPYVIDPSALVPIPNVARVKRGKMRQWVLATLQNHDRWLAKLGNTWPVLQIGGAKKRGGGVRVKGMSTVVPERDVVAAYAMNRGMLVAPYKNAGSGWWRPRYTFAQAMGAISYVGADDDVVAIGDSYDLSIAEIEELAEKELDELAARQKEEFELWQPSKEEVMKTLEAYTRL